ncbi:TPA: hypothetical protein N0F65_012203 [Lagenidium giganteum]|uniref:C2 domain-containing protein n=1 Tax=Lagenidium giganteum TaxID=4803 RepID=A0AAV2ZFM3_9STRA|nr:TPA: hypothetical protein N0F65_012203 [Lagenidium giganteum]
MYPEAQSQGAPMPQYGGPAGAPGMGMGAMPTSKVELSFSAKDLKDRDVLSKSDPFAVVYTKPRGSAQWVKLGQTEVIKDNLNPSWAKQFLLDFYFQEQQPLRVEIYDEDEKGGKLSQQDVIGATEFTLGQIMGAPGQSASLLLTRGGKSKHQGSLLVRAEEARESGEQVRFRFSASGLANMDGFFSKSDPFLVISRKRDDGSWVTVFKSETIDNNLNPQWKPFEIPVQKLCNGDHRRPLLLQVNDEDNGGKFELIGEVTTTLEEILGKKGNNFVLHNAKLQEKKGKKYTNGGLLVANEASLYRPHTFLDFLRGGLEMNLMIGIDYTASNGDPRDPRSLHFINPQQMNEYQHAIHSTGSILQEYDADKMFPVYGFGGIPPGFREVNHCFPLNLNPTNPEVQGIHGVMQLYTSSLGHVRLHGPTLFAPLINQAAQIAIHFSDPRRQKYFVLLILTDGAIMDMQQTIDALVNASHTAPLSIVIVGVGPADFSSMQALDGDGRALRASNGRIASRDIVQFVPFSRFAHNPPALANETLAEIPTQLCQYMKARGLAPNPPVAPSYQQIVPPNGGNPDGPGQAPPAAPGQAPGPDQAPPAQEGQAPAPAGQAPPAQGAPGSDPNQPPQQGFAQPPGAAPGQAPPQGFAPQGYGAPQGAPAGAPQPGYGAPPPQGYGAPPQGYGAPAPGYGAPPQGYGAPAPGYGAPPQGYAPAPGYGAPPQGFAPQQGFQQPPPGAAPGSGRQAAPGYPGYKGN